MDNDEAPEYLTRRSQPTKYDQMPLGTKIKVVANIDNKFRVDYYIQRSSDEENPHWVLTDF